MPDSSSLGAYPPVGVDPGDWLNLQRQQMLAQALMQQATAPIQQPETHPVNGLYVQPRVGWAQPVSKLADALLGSRAMDRVMQTQADVNRQSIQAFAPKLPDGSVNPRNPFGQPADVVARLAMSNPEAYAKYLQGTPEWQNALAAYGGDVNKAMAAMQAGYNKPVRNDETIYGPSAPGQAPVPVARAPSGTGVQTTVGPGGVMSQSNIQGSLQAQQAAAAAQAAGTQSQQFVEIGTDRNGRKLYGVLTPPGPGAGPPGVAGAPQPGATPQPRPSVMAATTPGATSSPAEQAQQKGGGEAASNYAADLAKNATGSVEVLRSLSELSNLSHQATPAAMNASKSRLGAMMIASGVPPETVSKWLGVDVGALQAAQKQTATLAVNTIHSMTNRGTNFDMQTFMENNPNLNLADPAAFQRVVDYMKGKATQEVAKNSDFVQWRRSPEGQQYSPDEWEGAHSAHWAQKQLQLIQAGQTNSRPPLSSYTTP